MVVDAEFASPMVTLNAMFTTYGSSLAGGTHTPKRHGPLSLDELTVTESALNVKFCVGGGVGVGGQAVASTAADATTAPSTVVRRAFMV